MKNVKKSRGYYPLEQVPGLTHKIWNETRSYSGHNWSVPTNSASVASLTALIGQTNANNLYAITNTATQNIQLRSLLSPLLKDSDMKIRLNAMRWVIYDWGHVRGRRGSEKEWPEQFGNYEASVIESFIEEHHRVRIASWSKALAFADSTKYAIYDARVAMSLNSILDKIGHDRKFYMPPPSSDDLGEVFTNVRKHVSTLYAVKKPAYMGYTEYMRLLNAFVHEKLAPNVLDAEMRLFANSDLHAAHYKTRHGI